MSLLIDHGKRAVVAAGRSQPGLDLTEAASERAATAMEGIADLLEQAHVALRQRLQGAPDQTPAPALPDQAEKEPARNGRKRLPAT
jgi:hypothetical protein